LGDFFPIVAGVEKAKQVRSRFRAERQKQLTQRRADEQAFLDQLLGFGGGLNAEDQTYGGVTQNVNGFGARASDRDAWFRSFRAQGSHGRNDIYLLQETHVEGGDI
ncbi:hypothetical protein PHYSODRAFT_453756, partial [Phytophthora sojae]